MERGDTVGRVFEGPARFGEKDLESILSSETHFSALLVCPLCVTLLEERCLWWLAVTFRSMSVNEVPCGP